MKKLNLSYEKKKSLYGYGFISLWFVGSLFFFIIPVIQSIYYSFCNVKPETGYLEKAWLGIANYRTAFMIDPQFRQLLVEALRNTAWKTPVILIFSLFVAIIINQKFKGRTFARAVFFLPVIIASGPVYSIITGDLSTSGNGNAEQFTTMFETDMVDKLLEFVGIYGFSTEFTNIISEMTSGILNLVWNCGIQIIIFLAALQEIPTAAKEAASMEGATAWEFFWKITLPYVSPKILVNLVYTVIDMFMDPTNEVMGRILAVKDEWKYGLSAAMAWSYSGIVLLALGLIFLILSKHIWYEVE